MINIQVYQEIARILNAMENCRKIKKDSNETLYNETYWYDRHAEKVDYIIKNYLPHGSGIDSKTEIDFEKSNDDKIVINSEYHCMNENGYYDGWVNFRILIIPCLLFGFKLKIIGNFGKYKHVKDYLHDLFYDNLTQNFDTEKYNRFYDDNNNQGG